MAVKLAARLKRKKSGLEVIPSVGPSIAGKMLDERKSGAFKDWNDLVTRVKGVGEGNAAKFSAQGLTVNGAAFSGVAAAAKGDKAGKKTAGKKTAETKDAKPAKP